MVGDIVKIQAGMSVPADCILIQGTDVACDESEMTGEPDQIEKNSLSVNNIKHQPDPFLLAKTLIMKGEGLALVVAVGPNTLCGRIVKKLNIDLVETHL